MGLKAWDIGLRVPPPVVSENPIHPGCMCVCARSSPLNDLALEEENPASKSSAVYVCMCTFSPNSVSSTPTQAMVFLEACSVAYENRVLAWMRAWPGLPSSKLSKSFGLRFSRNTVVAFGRLASRNAKLSSLFELLGSDFGVLFRVPRSLTVWGLRCQKFLEAGICSVFEAMDGYTRCGKRHVRQ